MEPLNPHIKANIATMLEESGLVCRVSSLLLIINRGKLKEAQVPLQILTIGEIQMNS